MQSRIRTFAAVAFAFAGWLSLAAQQSPAPAAKAMPGILPADAKGDAFVLAPDASRTYYVNSAGEVRLYDIKAKTTAKIADGPAWDLNLARSGAAILYARRGDGPSDRFIWVSQLDPKTGLAVGAARRVSASQGDVPSLSPDGTQVAFAKDAASGVGQSVVIMPLSGGTERVLVSGMPSIDHIRWSVDGTTIFFGVNPPPSCEPEWSCLPLERDASKQPGTIRRVPVAGGPATVVVTATRAGMPGLSPDGTLIASVDPKTPRVLALSDPTGRAIGTAPIAPSQTMLGWLDRSTVLTRSGGQTRRLMLTAATGGTARQIWDAPDPNLMYPPVWSPSGKLMAATRCLGGSGCELRILNADGSLNKSRALPESDAFMFAWSPDERSLSYTGTPAGQPPHLVVWNLATDALSIVYDMSKANAQSVFWLPDSKRLMLAEFANSEQGRKVAFRIVNPGGTPTLVRELALGPLPSAAYAIDETSAVVLDGNTHDFRIASLSTDQPARPILSGVDTTMSFAALSADRKWLAVRYARDPNAGLSELDVSKADGSERVNVHLPFQAMPTPGGLAVLPGGQAVVLAEAPYANPEPGVYLVTLATKSITKLFTYPARPGRIELTASADGRTVAYMVGDSTTPIISAIDLSIFTKLGR